VKGEREKERKRERKKEREREGERKNTRMRAEKSRYFSFIFYPSDESRRVP